MFDAFEDFYEDILASRYILSYLRTLDIANVCRVTHQEEDTNTSENHVGWGEYLPNQHQSETP